ncbi:hypothetical protein QBC41DRAFT_313337 [Cercophora samala]|uniref:Uncharacterized protein n=1 Tax=Cercophora samala TaxID=330535 RepID=A0AA40DGJ7_9PEZI|nr:hypothetical protein QBC41DRAFT_313337 [Cercophora samala]
MGLRMLKRTKWRWKGLPTGRQSPRGWLNHSGAILPVGTDLGGSSGGVARLTRPCDPVLYVIRSRRAKYRRIQHPVSKTENHSSETSLVLDLWWFCNGIEGGTGC